MMGAGARELIVAEYRVTGLPPTVIAELIAEVGPLWREQYHARPTGRDSPTPDATAIDNDGQDQVDDEDQDVDSERDGTAPIGDAAGARRASRIFDARQDHQATTPAAPVPLRELTDRQLGGEIPQETGQGIGPSRRTLRRPLWSACSAHPRSPSCPRTTPIVRPLTPG
ncbi:hypothetical protein BG418_34600 [Streptomyces sp. CBMA152]|nr:hypothetical protein [Streptomyces sp. CBMA152]